MTSTPSSESLTASRPNVTSIQQPETVILPNTSRGKQQRTPQCRSLPFYVLRDKFRQRSRIAANTARYNAHVRLRRHQRVHDRKRRGATRGEDCQQLIVDARNHLERGIEVDLRALFSGVTRAPTVVTFRVCSLYLTLKVRRIPT